MPTITVAGVAVEVTEDGFFAEPAQWSEHMIPELAAREGVTDPSEEQLRVVKFMRAEYARTGSGPNVRALSKTAGIPIKDLYRMFPGGPAKVAARIAGIPKPRGCI